MPNILAIETSIPAASIALKLGDQPPLKKKFESHRQQNQLLFSPLQQLLENMPNGDALDLIIVGTGPGSYSGSRISIAAAQGIAAAHDCPVVGQSSFLAVNKKIINHDCIAVGNARRGSFFIAEIPIRELPMEPVLMETEEFHQKLTATSCPIYTLEPNMKFPDGSPISLEHPTATNHISSWLRLSANARRKLLNMPPSPTYLRAPFITKAKPGHPLLRGKVNPRKTPNG